MSVFSLIAALLLEQLRPLPVRLVVVGPMRALAAFAEARLNGGEKRHGAVAWLLVVALPVLLAGGVFWLLSGISPLLGWAWNVAVLYLTMGFRQFSHYFTDIHVALRMGELDRARALIAEWRGRPVESLSSGEIARLAIEEALKASHRHVFAVIFWFVVLPGPCGALLYRSSALLAEFWGGEDAALTRFGAFARTAFVWIDWLPQRFTGAAFAIVGDFQDAIDCWRTQADRWPEREHGVILASGAGALGVRLGMPLVEQGEVTARDDLGIGDDADADFMQSTVGLVWRALVLWVLLLFMLGLARWVG